MISLQCSFFKISLLLITTLVVPFISQATEHAEISSISQPDIGTGEQNNPRIKLFELIGSQIYSGDLVPGTHLLTITARGINSSFPRQFFPIIGNLAIPEIEVRYSDNTKLESLEIYFPGSSDNIIGSAPLDYNRSTILAIRSEQPTLSISRADLLDALSKNKLEIGAPPAPMIISARSANQLENWQMVSFQ